MISVKFSEFMENSYDDHEEDHELYVLRGEGCVLYVGISRAGIWNRWFGMPSSHLTIWIDDTLTYGSQVGEAIVKCLPESMDWTIQLWTTEDCARFLEAQFKDVSDRKWCVRDIHRCETLMIAKLEPILNVASVQYSAKELPERIRRYKDEEEERIEKAYRKMFPNE